MIGVIQALPSPEADVWPTNSTKNILAKTPSGQEVVIGQQVHLKVYSDSARKNLVEKKELVFWRGQQKKELNIQLFFFAILLRINRIKKNKNTKTNPKTSKVLLPGKKITKLIYIIIAIQK